MDAVIIAMVSGKGGTGRTTASVFLGAALAGLGKRVALIELSSALRSVDIIAGVSGQAVFDIGDVLSGRSAPGRALAQSPHSEGLFIMPGPYSGGPIVPDRVRMLCTRLRAHFDYIFLDVQAGLGPAFEAAREVCHRMFLLLTPDLPALRDGRILADLVEHRELQLRLILNRVNPEQVLDTSGLADLDEAIDMVGAQLLGVIPESLEIPKSAVAGQALPKNSTEEKVFSAIARRITGEDVPLLVG